jgi:hypothetical protein
MQINDSISIYIFQFHSVFLSGTIGGICVFFHEHSILSTIIEYYGPVTFGLFLQSKIIEYYGPVAFGLFLQSTIIEYYGPVAFGLFLQHRYDV